MRRPRIALKIKCFFWRSYLRKIKKAENVVCVGDKGKSYRVLIGKPEQENFETLRRNGSNNIKVDILVSDFVGLEVKCWPLIPKFAGSNPAEAVRFFGRKILSTPSFGGEVKPSVPCRALCKTFLLRMLNDS
jgi:hypothetical protein